MMILDTIIEHKRQEVAARKAAMTIEMVRRAAEEAGLTRDFASALTDPSRPSPRVIAEIKRRSPSKGLLRPDLDPEDVAALYETNGAAAISVLTDEPFFGGSLDDLARARAAASLPVLCKEFIIDPFQLYEARAAGADAVLLIASVLDEEQLREFREEAARLGMAALVEVHNEAELSRAIMSDASIIGINNRDLRTFSVALDTTRSLLPFIPTGKTIVSESGIHTGADRLYMSEMGVDALLVGEGLISAPDPAAATREICGLEASLETSNL